MALALERELILKFQNAEVGRRRADTDLNVRRRIEEDNRIVQNIQYCQDINRTVAVADWQRAQVRQDRVRDMRREDDRVRKEMVVANEVLTMTRHERLAELYAKETADYEKELASLGKGFLSPDFKS
mmetsp:Transcript_24541/g.40372  ORF Transcript_24541/g.40372 Transcript_24541/m.40372 type:complete len:127 (+) Transcript_24541:88-468(+)